MVPVKIMERIARDLDMNKDNLLEESLSLEIRRRLAAYKFTDYLLSKKYKMTFQQFEKKRVVFKKKYSFEVEEDYHSWDQSADAISNLEKDLKLLER